MGILEKIRTKIKSIFALDPDAADYIVRSAESKRIARPHTTEEEKKELMETVKKVLGEIEL